MSSKVVRRAIDVAMRATERLGYTISRSVPPDTDPAIKQVVRRVAPFTMTRSLRVVSLCDAVEYIVRYGIGGSFVECGVWRGGSMMAAALTLRHRGVLDRDLFLYDTFSGMAPPTEHDISTDGRIATEMYPGTVSLNGQSDWAYASKEDVQRNMIETAYPIDRIHLIEGRVEETLPETAPDEIALLRLDTDWYESTLHELNHLYDRISPGGVLIIDDYGSWRGARRAVDEFFAPRPDPIYLHRVDGVARMAVVPDLR